MSKDEYILVESKTVYDGWCCKFFPEDQTFEWRDHYAVDRLSDERKQEIEQDVLENWT